MRIMPEFWHRMADDEQREEFFGALKEARDFLGCFAIVAAIALFYAKCMRWI